MICNHVGVETSLEALQWKGTKDFAVATPSVWTVNGDTAGYVRTFGSLSLLLVLNSGHMVPLDKPLQALDMISRFIKKGSFADSKGGVKPKAFLSDITHDSSLMPPIIEENPVPGDRMVAVSFTQNREAPVKSSGVVESGTGRYVVTSSPHGITAEGSSSPIVIKGLTNGVAYTFSVVSEIYEPGNTRTSVASAGSVAVTPGCGAALGDELLGEQRALLINREVSKDPVEDNMELSFSQSQSHGCIHGVCALDGESDRCLCFANYFGEDCSKYRKI